MIHILQLAGSPSSTKLPAELAGHRIFQVWTLYGAQTLEQAQAMVAVPLRHNQGAFIEDYVHDWNMQGDRLVTPDKTFRYYSRVSEKDVPVFVALFLERL